MNEEIKQETHSTEVGAKKYMSTKMAIIIAAIIVLLGLGYYYKGLFVAATVNGSPISRLSVVRALEKQSGKAELDTLIIRQLLGQEAKKKGVSVSQSEIDAEIKNIEEQVKAQGQTLDEALASQNITRDELASRIADQKLLEKVLADKVTVSDAEIAQYIKDNKITVPKGQETSYQAQIKDQLAKQKLQDAAGPYLASLKSQASIKYFVNY